MKSIKEGIIEYQKYKEEIKNGKSMGLLTPYNNFNQEVKNGLPWNTITSIAAFSGVGKSALLINICLSAPLLNPKTAVLIFSLEMPSRTIVARRLSYKLGKPIKELDKPDTDIDYTILDDIANESIFIDEEGGTPNAVYNKVENFIKSYSNDTNILIGLDHTLLLDGAEENDKISSICRLFNKLKLRYSNTTYIILSQLNDSMLKPERLSKKGVLMFPQYTDMMYGRQLYQASDTVICLNEPAKYVEEEKFQSSKKFDTEYGGLPLFVRNGNNKINIIYGHIIKGRDTGSGIIAWASQLHKNELIELNLNINI